MSEKFNLKWDDFHSNISKTFSALRTENDFQDVTLVSADLQQVSAHKVVLSACSKYFKNILQQNRHSNPLLCLDGVTSSELQSVLDYIYQGEVQVYQENLDRFLAVAERFQLEGLMNLPDTNKEQENSYETLEEFLPPTPSQSGVDKREYSNSQVKRSRLVKTEAETRAIVNIDVDTASNIDEIEARISENVLKNYDGTFSCKLCGKSGVKQRINMKNHVETHLEGLAFPCQNCGNTFRSRNSLNKHISTFHRT